MSATWESIYWKSNLLSSSFWKISHWAHSHFPGWRFNSLIYQDILFCINGWWLNEINGLYDGPGKWECAPAISTPHWPIVPDSACGEPPKMVARQRRSFKASQGIHRQSQCFFHWKWPHRFFSKEPQWLLDLGYVFWWTTHHKLMWNRMKDSFPLIWQHGWKSVLSVQGRCQPPG